jgi:hypothetical protein
MTATEQFCKITRERSAEHCSAGKLLFENGFYGQFISLLRQELDSLIRVVFLLSKDLNTREHFINQTLNNVKWTQPNSRAIITDKQMVDLTDSLNGWTNSVYKLGCAFIHLSPLADYKNGNPFQQLTAIEVIDIKQHLHQYHEFNLSNELNMVVIIPYLPKVLEKVAGNLKCYIEDLENGIIMNMAHI